MIGSSRQRARHGRRALRLAAFGIAAAATSLVVALICSLWSPLRRTEPLSTADASAIITRHLGPDAIDHVPGGTRTMGPGWTLVTAADTAMVHPLPLGAGVPPPDEAAAAASAGGTRQSVLFRQIPANPDDKFVSLYHAGWPAPCLGGARHRTGATVTDVWLVTPSPLLRRLGTKPMRQIPLRIQWLGLAANTAFYAGVFWLAVPGPILLRRHLRRRRGSCPWCGYDLTHTAPGVCPECGETRYAAS